MGDRSYVDFTFLGVHKESVGRILEVNFDNEPVITYVGGTCCIAFNEVFYGELDGLAGLQKEGIPYNSYWQAGHGYSAGGEYVRFTTEGEMVKKTIYVEEETAIQIHKLLKVLDDHAALKKVILDHQNFLTILPFDNQEEFGKRYRTKQLISP